MPSRFLDAMAAHPLLMDAGIGLRLILGGFLGRDEDSSRANLDEPSAVLAFHLDDVRAGSDCILSNTFAANRPNLATIGRSGDFAALNREGVRLAREAAGPGRLVIGSIGPIPGLSPSDYRDQADILTESGVDALLLETHTVESADAGLRALATDSPVPILASLHSWPDDAAGAARRLEDLGAAALGCNCGRSAADTLRHLERLAGRVDVPLLAKPSAGPDDGPEAFAALVPRFLALGVRLLGGCCGATADHLAAMRRVLS